MEGPEQSSGGGINKAWIALGFFALGLLVQSYRKDAKTKKRIDKVISDTEKEVTDAINALLTKAEEEGYTIPQVRDAIASTQENV